MKKNPPSCETASSAGFFYTGAMLHCDGVNLAALAKKHGTPLYVYSLRLMLRNYDRLANAFAEAAPLIAYSVKANSNLTLLKAMQRRGAGFDIVSVGELERVRRIGADPRTVIFAGVGKRPDEIALALEYGVGEFNIESPGEAECINDEARRLRLTAPVALRVNPNVDAHTHEYITTGRKENKFGINLEMAQAMVDRIRGLKHLRLVGLHAHIGSQILDPTVHASAVARLEEFATALLAQGIPLETLNMGGGFGIDYEKGQAPLAIERVAEQVAPMVRRLGLRLILEPGRFIIAPAGALLSRVLYVKQGSVKTFVIVDASMSELLRPSLYNAHHRIVPAREGGSARGTTFVADVVGPVCESGDFLARERTLPVVEPGDLLAILDAGAYGMVMASNYNTRPRPAEVVVDGKKVYLARERETLDDLLRHEVIPAAWRKKVSKARAGAKKPARRSVPPSKGKRRP